MKRLEIETRQQKPLFVNSRGTRLGWVGRPSQNPGPGSYRFISQCNPPHRVWMYSAVWPRGYYSDFSPHITALTKRSPSSQTPAQVSEGTVSMPAYPVRQGSKWSSLHKMEIYQRGLELNIIMISIKLTLWRICVKFKNINLCIWYLKKIAKFCQNWYSKEPRDMLEWLVTSWPRKTSLGIVINLLT